jgi:unsaturated chondroitin disaccharide hydrolase
MVYRETKDPRFLATAQKAAQFFIQHLPADFIPYWDFRLPTVQQEERDASAAAIAASGLLELSTFESDRDMRETYRNTAESIIAALCSAPYLAKGTMTNAILLHSVGNKPAKGEIDVPLIYADYYFLESLLRYRQIQHQ